MQLDDFNFNLPDQLVARFPLQKRTQSKLLVIKRKTKTKKNQHFKEVAKQLEPNDLLIFNDTQVIPARLYGKKETGGNIECLVEKIITEHSAYCHIKSSKRPKLNQKIIFSDSITAMVQHEHNQLITLAFSKPVMQVLNEIGHVPIPPYFKRAAETIDKTRYQTVYAKHPGAVAAPTAGLHFDEQIFEQLKQHQIKQTFLTLHVGAGTFKPIHTDNLSEHIMHTEHYHIPETCIEAIQQCKAQNGRIIAVGTTVVRALESMYNQHNELTPGWNSSELFIKPGFKFKCIDGMITNFHLPKSTLLVMISAFMGHQLMKDTYEHAIANNYRFYSYGDSMLIL